MVSSEQFRRPGGDEPHEEEGHAGSPGGLPFDHGKVVNMMRSLGIIPDFVPDEAVVIQAVDGQTGEVHTLESPGAEPPREWHLDDIFPHTSFDDPPGSHTEEEYKDMLLGTLSESDDLEDFILRVASGLGPDLVMAHHVPAELAMQVCEDFAGKIYKEYRTNA